MKLLLACLLLTVAPPASAAEKDEPPCKPGTPAIECHVANGSGSTLLCKLKAELAIMTSDWTDLGECISKAKASTKKSYQSAMRAAAKKAALADAVKKYQLQMMTFLDALQPKAGETRGDYNRRIAQAEGAVDLAANAISLEQ